LKDFANSTVYLNEFISKYKNDPNYNDAKLRLADSYFGIKKFDKASSIYREIFARERISLSNDNAYYQYGQALFKSGKPTEAIKIFEELQNKFPRSKFCDQAQYVIGWINFQQGNFSGAVSSYKHLLNDYPRSTLRPMVFYSIGDGYFNQAEYDSAITYYAIVIRNFPSTQYVFDAVNGIQYAYVAKNEPDRAIDYIDQFVSQNPDSKFGDQIYFKKGDLYYSVQKYNAAITAYKDFISRFPNSKLVANAYYWIGKSAANMRNDSEAIKNFLVAKKSALKSDIGISSSIELAQIYSDKKQYKEAVNALSEVITVQAGSSRLPELLFLKGINQVKNKQVEDAYSTFTRIITDFEGNIFIEKAKVEAGLIQMQLNNQDAAQKYFKEVAEGRPDDIGAAAQYYYGVSLFNQNNMPEAVTALVRVRSVYSAYDEWYSKSLLKLGDCYVKMKDKKQAREMYRAVLSKHSTGEFAQEAKRKLNQL
jgi:TolA-binding protein